MFVKQNEPADNCNQLYYVVVTLVIFVIIRQSSKFKITTNDYSEE